MTNATFSGTALPRHAKEQVERSMAEARVVVLNGPRQAGKTTLVRDLLDLGGTFASLDDEQELAAARADPRTYLMRPGPMIIDEFQRAGEPLLRAVKLAIDEDPRPGRYLLTGSTRFLTIPTISESLAGRAHIVDLWPFTQGEAERLGPEADGLLPALFARDAAVGWPPRETPSRKEYLERACRGGYPEAQRLDAPGRRRFFRNYVRTITQRDVPEISHIRRLDELPRILRLLAAMSGQEMKDTEIAARLSIDRRTLRANYLPVLRSVYLVFELPPWSRNLVSRVSRHAKSYLVDSGLAAHLLGTDPDRLSEPTAQGTGALVETFAVNELVRQTSRFGDDLGLALYHYRAHGGAEIDVVAETSDGRVVGIEIKAAATVGRRDFAHLAAVRDRIDGLPDARFERGVVLYTGDRALSFGDRLEALPLAALWRPPAS